MTKDPELADALERGRELLSAESAPEATLVHDLAVHGARLLADERTERHDYLRDLADHDWLDAHLDSDALEASEVDGLPVEL